ncbi:MAG TPA: hypothetical protein VF834_13870 [Streptosporangiaceae bacterium]
MVGQATRLAHGLFDPGPLQYWLLALPVHLDPVHGLVWGAALCCMLAASLTIEAARAVAGATGALLASGTVLATVAWMPAVALQPYWNPWFGVMFLLAALAAGWAALSGRRGWWPVLVITASVAAQAHLMFIVVSVGLVLLTFLVGLVDNVRDQAGYRWALTGLGAGAVCWIVPVLQEFTAPAGNLTALLRSQGASGGRTGLAFGLKALAGAVQPPPMWWTPLQSLLDLNLIDKRSAVFGAGTLAVLAAVAVIAVRPLRSRWLAALGGVSLMASAGSLVAYSGIAVQSIPAMPSSLYTMNYLMILMLPVGILAWFAVGGALGLAVRQIVRHTRAKSAPPRRPEARDRSGGRAGAGAGSVARRALPAAGLAAVVSLGLASSLSVQNSWRQFPGVADQQVVRAVSTASGQIERTLPPQPVALSVVSFDLNYDKRRLLLGLAYVLSTRGYRPELGGYGWELGPAYVARGQSDVRVRVVVRGTDVTVKISRP